MKKIIYIILFCHLITSCNNQKENKVGSEINDSRFSQLTLLADFFAEDILSKGNVNSFALAMYKDGQMYQNYYGKIHKDSVEKPNDSSLYEIASITKTFTGSLVAKTVLAGKLNLDDDIRKYLDNDYPNLQFESLPITIKHLLTHSLGFKVKTPPRLEAFNKKMNSGIVIENSESYTIQDLLEELKTIEVNKKPGTIYVYNSVGPELLAFILEKVNKQSYKDQLNAFFKDIGMNNTYLQESQKYKSRLVRGYKRDILAKVDYSPIYGAAGGAISTLPDLATYMKYLIDNKEKPWIKEASRILFTDNEEDENIGYLWQNIDYADEEGYFYSKTGTSNGTQSGILICPDSNYGIVLLVNNVSDAAMDDWIKLFFRDVEPMLIKYPKINLASIFRKDFKENPRKAYESFRAHKSDTTAYDFELKDLNNFGYDLLNEKHHNKAIKVFQFLTEEFPENANTYDSLGEAYFVTENYENALLSFKKALEVNPDIKTSKDYIKKIEDLILEKS